MKYLHPSFDPLTSPHEEAITLSIQVNYCRRRHHCGCPVHFYTA